MTAENPYNLETELIQKYTFMVKQNTMLEEIWRHKLWKMHNLCKAELKHFSADNIKCMKVEIWN